jgi:hypothetical protein
MIRPGSLHLFRCFVALREECRESVALFWYRIQWDVFHSLPILLACSERLSEGSCPDTPF